MSIKKETPFCGSSYITFQVMIFIPKKIAVTRKDHAGSIAGIDRWYDHCWRDIGADVHQRLFG
jgi:hypothetical protein